MPTELIIFDCDGTLTDSESVHNRAISELLTDMGYPSYTPRFCIENFAGKGMPAVCTLIEQRENIRLPENFTRDYTDMFIKKVPLEVKPVAHAIESVEYLAQKYKVCVASNGERENVTVSLKSLGLYDLFGEGRIFTASQVARGKPAPDLFLYAAERKNVAPENCLVIEDSISGINAGVAAGMRTIAITAASHNPLAATEMLKGAGAERVFATWPEIVDYIKLACG